MIKNYKGFSDDIYFIGNTEHKICKIGRSKEIHRRIIALQTANPYDLEILKTSSSKYLQEREYHKKFKKYLMRGEWFRLEGELEEYIKKPHWRTLENKEWSQEMINNAELNKNFFIFKGGHNLNYPIHCFSSILDTQAKYYPEWLKTNKEKHFDYYFNDKMVEVNKLKRI